MELSRASDLRGRRRFLRASGTVFALLFAPEFAAAQAPAQPEKVVAVDGSKYNKWLEEIRRAAERLAEESGSEPDAEANEEFEERAEETLEAKGYRVPKPPILNVQ